MRKTTLLLLLPLLICSYYSMKAAATKPANDAFVLGTPAIKSMSKLCFSPEGILFLGDSKGASVYAFDFKDNVSVSTTDPVNIMGIDKKIGALLGKPTSEILIHDLAVNPLSQNIYFTVSFGAANRGERSIYDPNALNDATILMKLSKNGAIHEVPLREDTLQSIKIV